jgi:hypothetical protein
LLTDMVEKCILQARCFFTRHGHRLAEYSLFSRTSTRRGRAYDRLMIGVFRTLLQGQLALAPRTRPLARPGSRARSRSVAVPGRCRRGKSPSSQSWLSGSRTAASAA